MSETDAVATAPVDVAEERRLKKNAYQRKQWGEMSPERRANRAAAKCKRQAEMPPEQRAEKNARNRKWWAANPDARSRRAREKRAAVRIRLFEMYGYECALCGFADRWALTLDHVKSNGAEERKRLGEHGVLKRALAKHRPDEYRILCRNCQIIAWREHTEGSDQ